MKPEDYPEIRSWVEGVRGDVDSIDFLTQHSSLAVWLAAAQVFWPDFKEVGGCVLWSRVYNENNFETWREHLNGDLGRIEATLNQLKLWQVIDCEDTAEDNRALQGVAEALSRCWSAALMNSFPDKRFDVRVVNTDDGPIVTFSTLR
ncbi:hypothetical protein [Streptomyces sp. RPT161]|uniref:hypothetical protein n=1 Tax=Streptomyces sp. RPT161 TaxID=3015993 RepID=UPI0022B89523|nr:hypothetical protein [Streptomyces sp. RPT161]